MQRFRKTVLGALGAVALVAAVAGCGSSSSSSDSTTKDAASTTSTASSGGQTVHVTMVADLTGPAAFAGLAVKAGAEIAVKQANASGAAGGNKLDVTFKDSATKLDQAVQLVSQATQSSDLAIMYAPLAPTAAATAPIAQRAKVPYIEIAGDHPKLLDTGDYVFHASAPPDSFQGPLAQVWAKQGVKTMARIYNSDNTSYTSIIKDAWDKAAQENGIDIVATEKILTTDTDFASVAAAVADKAPDAVMVGGLGAQFPTLVTQLRRAGYKGKIGGVSGSIMYGLPSLGKAADGIMYATDFTPAATDAPAQEFTALYKKATGGKLPGTFEAMGYDAIGLLAAGIKEAPELTRSGVKDGLDKALAEGYQGAAGKITFGPGTGGARDAHVTGRVVVWTGGKETLATP